MEGEMGIESDSGKGSTFWFKVKLGRSTSDERPPGNFMDRLRGLKVLVVDDHHTNRQIHWERPVLGE